MRNVAPMSGTHAHNATMRNVAPMAVAAQALPVADLVSEPSIAPIIERNIE
jgi:hypothetical protein